MANWCNNYLELTTKERPTWVNAEEIDYVFPLLGHDYAHGLEMKCWESNPVDITLGKNISCWITQMSFQTKYSPPISFYEELVKDCMDIYAFYEEPGSEIYGQFDMNGHDERKWPNEYYSEICDQYIYATKPDDLFISEIREEFFTFSDYIREMHTEFLTASDNKKEYIVKEIVLCAEQLKITDTSWRNVMGLTS